MTLIVSEVAQAHEGSLGLAHSFIDASASSGAGAVKFQAHYAEFESTYQEPFRLKLSSQDDTRYQYWQRMEFSLSEWRELSSHAHDLGLLFIVSPFSVESINILNSVSIDMWKIGSGEVLNTPLLHRLNQEDKPIILSNGLSSDDELEAALSLLHNHDLTLLECTSSYPAQLCDVNIQNIQRLKHKYNIKTGLSDHSGTVYPSLAAISNNADMIEVHITFSKHMYGYDASASLDPNQLKLVCDFNKAYHTMISNDSLLSNKTAMRNVFGRSLALSKSMPCGTCITRDMLVLKKPGTGIPPSCLEELIGKKLCRDVDSRNLLQYNDFLP